MRHYKKGKDHHWYGKHHTEKTKNKMRGIRKKRPSKKCLICNKNIKLKYPYLEKITKYCSRKCFEKHIKITRREKGNPMFGKVAWNRNKHIQTNTGRTHFKKGHHPKNEFKKGHKLPPDIEQRRISNVIKGNNRKTKPEIKTEKILKNILPNEYKYVGDGSLMIESFNPDFVNKTNDKIIEIFGDYWHNLKRMRKKDNYRFQVYRRNNYKTLVIWEHELDNISKVTKKILHFSGRR